MFIHFCMYVIIDMYNTKILPSLGRSFFRTNGIGENMKLQICRLPYLLQLPYMRSSFLKASENFANVTMANAVSYV